MSEASNTSNGVHLCLLKYIVQNKENKDWFPVWFPVT